VVPTIASSGSSFKGAAAYYLHDKEADSRERIAWMHTENLVTNDPDRAWKVMAWTANNQSTLKTQAGVRATGRKLQKPVFAFSLSWHPEQTPDKDHMLAAAKEAAAALDLSEHQTIYVSHNDEPHRHVHVLVNRVHPATGKAATLSKSKERLSAWALAYEKKHGKIYCKARGNAEDRQIEPKEKPARNPVIQAAWEKSNSGRSFQAALAAEHYTLAQGNRRFVVVDRWGKAINPVRHLPGVRAAAFQARLRDLDPKTLPLATAVQKQIKAEERKQYTASRQYDRWAAEYTNQLQDRHLDERAKLQIHYERAHDEKIIELAAAYQTREREKAMDQLRQKIEKAGFFRRITGGVKRDRADLAAQEQLYQDIQKRTAEQVDAIATERAFALSDQADRHGREKELAQEYITDKKPAFYKMEERVAERGRGASQDGGRERADGTEPS